LLPREIKQAELRTILIAFGEDVATQLSEGRPVVEIDLPGELKFRADTKHSGHVRFLAMAKRMHEAKPAGTTLSAHSLTPSTHSLSLPPLLP